MHTFEYTLFIVFMLENEMRTHIKSDEVPQRRRDRSRLCRSDDFHALYLSPADLIVGAFGSGEVSVYR